MKERERRILFQKILRILITSLHLYVIVDMVENVFFYYGIGAVSTRVLFYYFEYIYMKGTEFHKLHIENMNF